MSSLLKKVGFYKISVCTYVASDAGEETSRSIFTKLLTNILTSPMWIYKKEFCKI